MKSALLSCSFETRNETHMNYYAIESRVRKSSARLDVSGEFKMKMKTENNEQCCFPLT